jgi:hypothetical protein
MLDCRSAGAWSGTVGAWLTLDSTAAGMALLIRRTACRHSWRSASKAEVLTARGEVDDGRHHAGATHAEGDPDGA